MIREKIGSVVATSLGIDKEESQLFEVSTDSTITYKKYGSNDHMQKAYQLISLNYNFYLTTNFNLKLLGKTSSFIYI